MRVNLPVTSNEYPFPKGETLVSTTDSKGRITYCNPKFIEVSGYSKEELIGKPHNIIRHPDMPEEAFRDMWDTIKQGLSWSAPVKNRRKNGDFYWVMANATPLLNEQGTPIGYMSVRTEATEDQITEAEELYQQMRREKEKGQRILTLQQGRVVNRTVLGLLDDYLHIGLAAKLFIALLVVLLTPALLYYLVPEHIPQRHTILALLSVITLVLAWHWLIRRVVRPLQGLSRAAHRMASGDLSQSLNDTRSDEIGQLAHALNQLSVNLFSIVRDAREQSRLMLLLTQEIAQSNIDLSRRTESQAHSLEQTAEAMEEITSTVRETTHSATTAATLSLSARHVVQKGNDAVMAMSTTMNEIQHSSAKISEITQTIESIAFQTNILALNAAVEAARAGTQGRGFAIVANEVRSLAQRTSSAAKEIKTMIQGSVVLIQQGHTQAVSTQATMGEVAESVEQVTNIVNTISQAAQEQLSGISHVNEAITRLDSITQDNVAQVETIAASARVLEEKAVCVTETVQVFQLNRRQ